MKKIIYYLIGFTIIFSLLVYFFGENGFVVAILGSLGIGSRKLGDLKREGMRLDQEAKRKQEELKQIEEDKKKLDKDGVKDLSPEEEKKYWEDQ